MVEVENASRVEVLHHQQVTCITPVFYLHLALSRLFHSIHKHPSEVLALSGQDGFVAIDRLVLHHEDYIGKSWVVDYCAHVSD